MLYNDAARIPVFIAKAEHSVTFLLQRVKKPQSLSENMFITMRIG